MPAEAHARLRPRPEYIRYASAELGENELLQAFARWQSRDASVAKQKDSKRSSLAVKDFGPIAEATVELRPFTVFVGASNTGKSYLAILLYALHQFFRSWHRVDILPPEFDITPTNDRLDDVREWLAQTVVEKRGSHFVDIVLPEDIAALVRPALEDVGGAAPVFDAHVSRCFGVAEIQSLIRQSGGKSTRITLDSAHGSTSLEQPDLSYHFTIARAGSQIAASVSPDMPLRIHIPTSELPWMANRRRPLGLLTDRVVADAIGAMVRPIHYLPADRAGVMHAHRVVVSSLIGRASRAGLGVESPLPALSGVLADFLEQLIDLGDTKYEAGYRRSRGSRQLAERLEAEILGGAVGIHRSAVGYPSFHYRPAEWKRDLPLMNTSSMVSELAPVVLYLRYIVQPGDVLIIEEPESHLHPAMQVAFTRLLAAVARSGVRVVLTTHSEWVLEALANLVRLSEVDRAQRQEIAGDDLALTPDQVGAWLFEQKRRPKGSVVKEIPLDVRRGTFPAGFSEITEQLYNDWAGIANLVAERSE